VSQVFTERKLEFTFDDTWTVQKWDDEPAYRKGIGTLQRTLAADFCGMRNGMLFLFEVKDFRGYRIQNEARLTQLDVPDVAPGDMPKKGEIVALMAEIAWKVRDTIAGIVGARRCRSDEAHWQPMLHALGDPDAGLHVVLWLEEDLPRNSVQTSILQANLRNKLAWLTTKVLVSSLTDRQSIPGVQVRSLLGAGSGVDQ
jgi:hypothetical protein